MIMRWAWRKYINDNEEQKKKSLGGNKEGAEKVGGWGGPGRGESDHGRRLWWQRALDTKEKMRIPSRQSSPLTCF